MRDNPLWALAEFLRLQGFQAEVASGHPLPPRGKYDLRIEYQNLALLAIAPNASPIAVDEIFSNW